MADKKISELTLHTSLQLSDVIAIVNSNETKKTTYGSLYDGIRDGLISGSSQVDYTQIQNTPVDLISSSQQITNFGFISESVDLSALNIFTASADSRLDALEAATGSYLTGEDTGSLMVTGSLSGSSLVFEKGDTTTFDIDLSSTFITPSQTGSLVQSAYISLYSSASQQLAVSGAAQPVTFTSVWANSGVNLVSGSQLVMEKAGVYQFNFVVQIQNTENAVHDSYFWVKYNGSNFPNSATQMSLLPRKNESTPSAQLVTVNIVGVAQHDNDYIELYWTGDSDTIRLNETPANGPVPETPSVIADIIRVG